MKKNTIKIFIFMKSPWMFNPCASVGIVHREMHFGVLRFCFVSECFRKKSETNFQSFKIFIFRLCKNTSDDRTTKFNRKSKKKLKNESTRKSRKKVRKKKVRITKRLLCSDLESSICPNLKTPKTICPKRTKFDLDSWPCGDRKRNSPNICPKMSDFGF